MHTSEPPSLLQEPDAPWPGMTRAQMRFNRCCAVLQRPTVSMGDLRTLARDGVPDPLRPDLWPLLLGIAPLDPARRAEACSARQREYSSLASEGMERCDPHRIVVDVPRTMPSLHFFSGGNDSALPSEAHLTVPQRVLYNILRTFARLHHGAGYAQGMNELVGHLLFALSGGDRDRVASVEADVYFCFEALHRLVGDGFSREPDLAPSGVAGTLVAFSRVLAAHDPDLHAHLVHVDLKPEFYAFRWITLLFTQEFVAPDLLSLWDFLLSQGDELPQCAVCVAVAIVAAQRAELLTASFGEAMQLLQLQPTAVDVDTLPATALAILEASGGAGGVRNLASGAEPESGWWRLASSTAGHVLGLLQRR